MVEAAPPVPGIRLEVPADVVAGIKFLGQSLQGLGSQAMELAWMDGFRSGLVAGLLACGALALVVLFLRKKS